VNKDPKIENLEPFKKGQSGNPNGRPKKFVTTLKEQGYKRSEINDTIQAMLSMNLEELKEVFEDKNATILEKTIANAMKKSLEKGSLYSIETLISRVYGQPKQEIEQTIIEKPIFTGINLDVTEDNSTDENK
jgi:pyruvate dehydrogenase complex dehydrogenase (E1) component